MVSQQISVTVADQKIRGPQGPLTRIKLENRGPKQVRPLFYYLPQMLGNTFPLWERIPSFGKK